MGSIHGPRRSHMPWGAKPVHNIYWARALEPWSHNYWAHRPQLEKLPHPRACALQREKPQQEARARQLEDGPHLPQLEKNPSSSEDPARPKIINTYIYFFKCKKTAFLGNSLAVQWLELSTSSTLGSGSIPGPENKTPQTTSQVARW